MIQKKSRKAGNQQINKILHFEGKERIGIMGIKKEDITLPDYEELVNCIYDKFLWDAEQEFDYETYGKVLDKIGQVVGSLSSDYRELEDSITTGFQDSARHGFLMGARLTMIFLFGWQQAPGMEDIKKYLDAGSRLPAAAPKLEPSK